MIVSAPTQALVDACGRIDGVEFVLRDGTTPPPSDDIEVVILDYRHPYATLSQLGKLPRLKVVQTQTAGVDGIAERIPDGVLLANARGVHDDATAELALGLIIASLRGIDDAVRNHGHWSRGPDRRSLADAHVTIVGYGAIGRALANRLLASRAVVTAVASRDRADDLVGDVVTSDAVDWASQHVVVVVLPLNDATRQIVDADFLAALADDTLVVNVGRGALLDTDAVLKEAGRLRFALDVTDPEPLPDDHPLWAAPGVLITPHIGGGSTAMLPRMAALMRDRVTRWSSTK